MLRKLNTPSKRVGFLLWLIGLALLAIGFLGFWDTRDTIGYFLERMAEGPFDAYRSWGREYRGWAALLAWIGILFLVAGGILAFAYDTTVAPLSRWIATGGRQPSSADKLIASMDQAISFSAQKWVYFDRRVPLGSKLTLKDKIALFLPAISDGLKSNYPAFREANGAVLLLIAAKGVERSGTHSKDEIEWALGIDLPEHPS